MTKNNRVPASGLFFKLAQSVLKNPKASEFPSSPFTAVAKSLGFKQKAKAKAKAKAKKVSPQSTPTLGGKARKGRSSKMLTGTLG